MFFSTDGKQLFIEDVQVLAEASHGQQLFLEKLEQRAAGQMGSVDGEFAKGDIFAKAEEKGVTLNPPPRQGTSHGKFPKTEFVYDAEADTDTCPPGQSLSHRGTTRKKGERHYRPDPGTWAACPPCGSPVRALKPDGPSLGIAMKPNGNGNGTMPARQRR